MIDITKSIKACAAFYGKDADAMELYLKEGEKKALDLTIEAQSNLMIMVIFVKKFVNLILNMVFTYLRMLLIQMN